MSLARIVPVVNDPTRGLSSCWQRAAPSD